jgi:hypothetical protein
VKRLACAAVLVLALASCGVGVRLPATDVTETSATLNGKAVSTVGGSGTYFFVYGVPGSSRSSGEKNVQFSSGGTPVSFPVDHLVGGVVYGYRLCVGDSENPGAGDGCSPTQKFRTPGPTGPAFHSQGNPNCAGPNDFSQEAFIANYEPNTRYGFRLDLLSGPGTAGTLVTTDEDGNAGIGSIGLTEPARARVRLWLDDGDGVLESGEEVVLDDIYVVEEPCTDAEPEEPSPT